MSSSSSGKHRYPKHHSGSKEDDTEDAEMIDMSSGLARSGRRASISMPTGLDLLVKLAEYSWVSEVKLVIG